MESGVARKAYWPRQKLHGWLWVAAIAMLVIGTIVSTRSTVLRRVCDAHFVATLPPATLVTDGDTMAVGARPIGGVAGAESGAVSRLDWRRATLEHGLRLRERSLQGLRTFIDTFDRRGQRREYLGPVFFEAFRPLVFCDDEQRIGDPGDGGKWVCNAAIRQPCIVYSFGSNGDTSFEDGMKRIHGCEMHTFDPTLSPAVMQAVYRRTDVTTFHPWGVKHYSGTADFAPKAYNVTVLQFADIMERLGHTAIDVVKMDIESAEWAVIPTMFKKGMPYIGQIQLEVHVSTRVRRPYERLQQLIENMEKHNYFLFHTEINALAVGCTELAFIRLDLLP